MTGGDSPRKGSASERLLLALVLALVAAATWGARDVWGLKHPSGPLEGPDAVAESDWFSRDPDGLYHARRVERALEDGLSVAGRDPRLNHPEGAPIPWPPYYDLALAAALGTFAPEQPAARHAWIERAVATAPAVLAVATALVAALVGWLVAGAGGAAFCGLFVAFSRASLNYSVVGCGDHHAWVTLLNAALLAGLCIALQPAHLRHRGRSVAAGLAAGGVAGLMLGSWVAALLYVIDVQLVLAWLLVRRGREELPGLAPLGLAFHLAAAATILPAAASSPWNESHPWIVVNLSWFHPALLLVGALVFVPPLVLGPRLATGTAGGRRYPLFVAVALVALGAALAASGLGPARGVAEGFAWVGRSDSFMATVQESAPLVGARAGSSAVLFDVLGWGVLLLPFAWVVAAVAAFKRGSALALPWVVSVPPLVLQALQQRRFAEAVVVPMAVVLAFAVRGRARAARPWIAAIAGVALALALQQPGVRRVLELRAHGDRASVGTRTDGVLAERRALEWIRGAAAPAEEPGSVLAHWDKGHAIEQVAGLPSVATNFGSYVGVESYRDPPRFFLAETPGAARAVLERRDVRYVLAPTSLGRTGPAMRRILVDAGEYVGELDADRWSRTMSAALVRDGNWRFPGGPELRPPGFLRLVHVSPFVDGRYTGRDGAPRPWGFVWERVEGAVLEARTAPGTMLTARFRVRFDGAGYEHLWSGAARAGPDGVATLRVPYAGRGRAGDGVVVSAEWTLGDESGALQVDPGAVAAGAAVRVP